MKRIYLCLAHMSDAGLEQKYVKEAFDTNWVVPLGPNVDAFEQDLKRYEAPECEVVALSSGTASLHLALVMAGVGPGDEVIASSFTFCASANPIKYLGATPIFVDSEWETWNMDPEMLETAIIDRVKVTGKTPKAIVVVDLYGMPAQLDRIEMIANRYGIPLIEDAANSFGSLYKGKRCGTFGRYGVLSFNGNKMITTSGGGALVCSSVEEKNKVMWYATQAREGYPYYQHETIGYNYRMSNVCAGIGRGQMTVLEQHIARHKHIQKMYESLLGDVPGIKMHSQPSTGEYDSNYWLCTMTLAPTLKVKGQDGVYKNTIRDAVGGAAGIIRQTQTLHTDCEPNANVEAMRLGLDALGIEVRPLWKPMHRQPVYQDSPAYVNGVSENLFKVGMCLPSGPCVSDDDVVYIVDCIKSLLQ